MDSTMLAERLGDILIAQLWDAHDRRARDLLARYHGREIGRTDGFLLMFDDAHNAGRYAVAYHQALAEAGFIARVGMHVGDVTLRENARADIGLGAKPIEIVGLTVAFAARVMSLARGGQTLVSTAARAALGDTPPEGTAFESHGFYRLKGFEYPVEIFELGVRGVAPFAPPPDADKAYRVVRAGDLWRPVREVRHNLPAERDAFIGRTEELRALASRLAAGTRLLTVLGPGGTGKTRCVCRYGWTWLGDWPGGIYFCDLSEAKSLDGILFAVASALDVALGKDDPPVQLGHAIAGRGRCLVVLDNFEQIVSHAAATLGRWLDRAVDAAFLVTSRERLQLPGEQIFPLEPLPLKTDAIDLFVTRAHAQRSDLVLNAANRASVAEVVRLLDGLPLAIELAAARIRVLSPSQLLERLADRFHLLAGAGGTVTRQATLRATIDWSWHLLSPWEQDALAQCSVFEGGFALAAAEVTLDLTQWPEAPPTLDAVQALVDKSLLRTWIPAAQDRYSIDEPYFGMYVSIHEYAEEKLDASSGDARRAAEVRHGRYFARFGMEEALAALHGKGSVQRRHALAFAVDNLVAACRRAVTRGDEDTAVATYRAAWEALELQGPLALGMVLGGQVLSLNGMTDSSRAAALATRALALHRSGRTEDAATGYQQALALARELGDRNQEGSILLNLGYVQRERGQMDEAHALLEAALAIRRDTGDRRSEGTVLGHLGTLHRDQGRMDEAQARYQAALAIHREVGNRRSEGIVLDNLGMLHLEQGRMDEARAHFEAAIVIHREVGNRRSEGIVLGNLSTLHREQGRMEEAREHFEAAIAIHREVGNRRSEGIVLGNLGHIHLTQGRVDEGQAHYNNALAIHREVGNRRSEGVVLGNLANLYRDHGRIDEAEAHYRDALAIHREVGNRSVESYVIGDWGELHLRQGRLGEARANYEAALAIACDVGNPRLKGSVLGNLGDVLARQGRLGEAREALREGEALLRGVGERFDLARLLCARGRVEGAGGDRGAAHAALVEAEQIASTIGAGPESELGREIEKVREKLA
ncbi:MAG: tetratricopeptide repeat protein [Casimicrobiaceae bacterium]